MIIGIGERRASGDELRSVACDRVAASILVGGVGRVDLREDDRLVFEVDEAIGQIELSGGARLDTDGGALELIDGRRVDQRRVHHDRLPVVEGRRGEQAPAGIAADGPSRVTDEHVDLAGLERWPALIGVDGSEFDRLGIAEHGCGKRSAEVGVEADHLAILVEEAEAGETAVHAADQLAAFLHGGQATTGRRRCGRLGFVRRDGDIRCIGCGRQGRAGIL